MLDLLLPWWPAVGGGSSAAVAPPPPPETDPVPVFGWPIYSDRSVSHVPTVSGGSWRSTLPLSSLLDRKLARVARSTNATLAATQFVVDLRTERPVGVLALPKHTMSQAARIRWRASASTSFAAPIYDSDWRTVWPLWATREDVDGLNVAHVHLPPAPVTARYWLCEIDDTSNAAGFVDVARLVVAGAWTPSSGIALGARYALESATERVVSDGGAALYVPKPVRRVFEFSVPMLDEPEAFTVVWRMIRQLGVSGQLFLVYDRHDPYMHERAFLGVLRELSSIDFPAVTEHEVAFRVLEEL
ncbi:hypothetical protein [Gemmatimonas sp.]|uniref:hypothetical protein n=1 Tax=Gemmatimonas sp. TaxID=1962908 RepID=UPI00334081C1